MRRRRRRLADQGVDGRRADLAVMDHLPRVDRIVLDPVFGVSTGDAEPRSASKQEFVAALMGERLAAPTR